MHLTPVYAALFALFYSALSVRALRLRGRLKIALGDGGDKRLLRATRVHGNFAEYVPMTLLLIFMFELDGGSAGWIHALCAVLLVGRVSHAYGVAQVDEDFRFRVFGMASTFTSMVGAALLILV